MGWFFYALGGAICFGSMQLVFKYLAVRSVGIAFTLVLLSGVTGILYYARARIAGEIFVSDRMTIALILVASVFSFFGNMMTLKALGTAPNPGYASVIAGSQGVVVTLVSVGLFGSSLTAGKMIGVLLCFAGGCFLAIG